MQILAGKAMERRTFLRGLGATLALPYLDAMEPAFRSLRQFGGPSAAADKTRLVCMGSCMVARDPYVGASKNLWAPAKIGRDFQLNPDGALAPLEPWREYMTIVSNTDVRMAEAFEAPEIGGDHFRSSAVFLTQSHPKQTQGSDVYVGTSLDQIVARKIAEDTAIPSMQLCIENQDRGGGCDYNYACAYTDTLSWASPTDPLPMIRNPRIAFDQLFGAGSNNTDRAARRKANQSILDWIVGDLAGLKRDPDRRTASGSTSTSGHSRARASHPGDRGEERQRRPARAARSAVRRAGLVRRAHEAHVRHPGARVRVGHDARVLVQDRTRRVHARVPESGTDKAFHPASHHGGRESAILDFNKINRYHVSMLPYFLEKLKNTKEGDSNLLDKTVIVYGSPMADGNIHNHRRCPLLLLGKGNGRLPGNMHLKAPDATPMANVMLTLAHQFGCNDVRSFGDSTGEFTLTG
jgi:hypothetical protein